jgi:hypothetical protein
VTTLLRLLAWLSKRRGMELSGVCAELRREWYSRELIARIAAFHAALDGDEYEVAERLLEELRRDGEIDGAELVGMSTDLAFLRPDRGGGPTEADV